MGSPFTSDAKNDRVGERLLKMVFKVSMYERILKPSCHANHIVGLASSV